MRERLPILVLALLVAGCGYDPVSPPPPSTAQIIVWVHVGDQPVPDVQTEVLGTSHSGTTGADGKVQFTVSPGEYTVRVHYHSRVFDHHVNVRNGDEAIIDSDYL